MRTQLEPHALLPPVDGATTRWWRVRGSAMVFENAGFSRAAGGRKYVVCAECELGPLGWTAEGGAQEFWVAADRVGYV
jgi:hypothetical protein